jgi:hypothetical protein
MYSRVEPIVAAAPTRGKKVRHVALLIIVALLISAHRPSAETVTIGTVVDSCPAIKVPIDSRRQLETAG